MKSEIDNVKLARVFTAIYECVDKYRTSVSFVNLTEAVGEDAMGDLLLESVGRSNVAYWGGMSPEFAQAIAALVAGAVLKMFRCDPLLYVIDGCISNLPVADEGDAFESLHWQPVVFEPGARP